MNKDNLLILANYLATLPDDYAAFEMDVYFETQACRELRKAADYRSLPYAEQLTKDRPIQNDYALKNGGVTTCGAVACALGHGPSAGLLALPEDFSRATGHIDWSDYQVRVFGLEDDDWSWCFDADWSTFDNTPFGAAQRIRYLVANGAPPEGYCEPDGDQVEIYQDY